MTHKFCIEALDRSFRDIMNFYSNADSPFWGKIVVFGDDFKQILQIIPRESWFDIINATINSSYL